MLRKFTLFTVICLLLFSCKEKDKLYNRDGVSFIIPSGWKIAIESRGIVICVRDPFLAHGTFTIRWKDDSADTQQEIRNSIKDYDKPSIKKALNPLFGPILPASFGRYTGYSTGYKMKNAVIPAIGYISSFYTHNKTFIVELYEEANDEKVNAEAVHKMENSLQCN